MSNRLLDSIDGFVRSSLSRVYPQHLRWSSGADDRETLVGTIGAKSSAPAISSPTIFFPCHHSFKPGDAFRCAVNILHHKMTQDDGGVQYMTRLLTL